MSNSLLERLIAAQTDEERSWIVTENLLESLPKDVARALWAVAIPHWFDAEILAALCPELADRAEELYRQLQTISCVEVFSERGHNVHELTRNQLLERLWQNNPEHFRAFSGKAAEHFKKGDSSKNQIEWIYHLIVVEPNRGRREFLNLSRKWNNNFHRAELESLIINLQQQIVANSTVAAVQSEITSQRYHSAISNYLQNILNSVIKASKQHIRRVKSLIIKFLLSISALHYNSSISSTRVIKTSLLTITNNTLQFDNTIYPVKEICSVSLSDLTEVYKLRQFLLSWCWFLLALGVVLLTFSPLGIPILIFDGWLFWRYKTIRRHSLRISMSSGEEITLISRNREFINQIITILFDVINSDEQKYVDINFDACSITISNFSSSSTFEIEEEQKRMGSKNKGDYNP